METSTADELVRARIQEKGRITFAEFMGLALYGPGGYRSVAAWPEKTSASFGFAGC